MFKTHTHTVIASVLKPITDPRMDSKLRQLIPKSWGSVTIVGKKVSKFPPTVHYKELFNFKRLSVLRIFVEFTFLYYLLKSRPKYLIVCTYELLLAAIVYKYILKWIQRLTLQNNSQNHIFIIYDIQENYALNVKSGELYKKWIRNFLAFLIETKEKCLVPFCDHVLIAEKCYTEELSFLPKNCTIIENKAHDSLLNYKKEKQKNQYCITGTLGAAYGTLEAIAYFNTINISNQHHLTIAGYCADEHYAKKIIEACSRLKNCTVWGITEPVLQEKIIEIIAESSYSLQLYNLQNQSFLKKIPTKFYECLILNTPIICSENQFWSQFLARYNSFPLEKNLLDELIFKYPTLDKLTNIK
ncbi:MAG: hypothetical protein U0V72_11610 [Cytophagales bacterium]